MKRTALSIYHGRKGGHRSPISFSFPEPSSGQIISRSRSGDGDKGWECSSLGAGGIGLSLSYRQYQVTEPTTFIVEPSEPVACLRLTYGKGTTIGFKGKKHLPASDNPLDHFFWMGDRTMEFTLQPGEHFHLDLFMRSENLSHLSDRSAVMEIIDSSFDGQPTVPLGIPLMTSENIEEFLREMLEELDKGEPTTERFTELCDGLILKCLGEDVDIPKVGHDPIEKDGHPSEKEQRRYLLTAEQQSLIDSMYSTSRQGLEKGYFYSLKKLEKLKRRWRKLSKKVNFLSQIRKREQLRANEKYVDLMMKAARFMAENHQIEGLEKATKTLLRRAIGRCCSMAFGVRPPSLKEMDLCAKWINRPINLGGTMDMGFPGELLSYLFPDSALDKEPEADPIHGGGLLLEQIRETFGFRSPSELTGRTDDDRPVEVVQTYNRLIEKFAETLSTGEDGITRSNLVRKLDAAYENDDLVALLQLEVAHLGREPDFLDNMEDDRLKYTIMAITLESSEYMGLIADIETESGYRDIMLFKNLENDLRRFRSAVTEEYPDIQDKYRELMETIKKTKENLSTSNLRELAMLVLTGKIKK